MCNSIGLRICSILVLIISIIFGWSYLKQENSCYYSVDVTYFGPTTKEPSEPENDSINRFQVPYEQKQVDDLKDRLRRTRFYKTQLIVDNIEVNRSTYGFNYQTAESVQSYFLNKFDWKETVKTLNEFDHFKTNIAGLDIHFVRVTKNLSNNQKKNPILFLHGWPGSFLEYLDVARRLNSTANAKYDLIIPSLPGYGYSEAPHRAGMNPIQIARIMNELMKRLGYTSYFVCGGDWGSIIGTFMAQLYPNNVRGLLITLVMPIYTWQDVIRMTLAHLISASIILDREEQIFHDGYYNALDQLKFLWTESGYFHLQATKPDTIGYALNDSPIGLATYILEKWSRWSNTQSQVDKSMNSGLDHFTLDQLLSNVMLYWTTGTITSSMRIYFEYFQAFTSNYYGRIFNGPVPASVPVAIVNYRHELLYVPRVIAQKKYTNISLWLYHESGGHFASLELPNEYAHDIEKFLISLNYA